MRLEKKTIFTPILLMIMVAAFVCAAALPSSVSASAAGLLVTVDITPELKARTNPGQVVFIYAKAVHGPKAPLAAVRTKVNDLPFTVTLDGSKALTPMFRLSNFKDVQVSAHVSQRGQAIRGSGDLEGVSPEITLAESNRPVKIIIDHVIP